MMLRAATARGMSAQVLGGRAATATKAPTANSIGVTKLNAARSFSASAGGILKELATENPYKDVVRYEHKNRKWNLQHVDYYSEALAIGFVETGLQPGDVILSWLPAHFSESMVLQFACSKAGLVLYNLDPSLAITDPDKAREALASALKLTKANVLISQEAGDDVNYVRLCERVIPEIRYFDFAEGLPFVTPRFPHLRFPVHTGFDQADKWGMLRYRHFIVPSDNLKDHLAGFTPSDSTPLLGELVLDASGVPTSVGKVKTNAEVMEMGGEFSTFNSILKKEFHEVDGVGVVF